MKKTIYLHTYPKSPAMKSVPAPATGLAGRGKSRDVREDRSLRQEKLGSSGEHNDTRSQKSALCLSRKGQPLKWAGYRSS